MSPSSVSFLQKSVFESMLSKYKFSTFIPLTQKRTFDEIVKWGGSFRWSFRPNYTWGGMEMTTFGKTHSTLLKEAEQSVWFGISLTYKIITLRSRFHHNIFDSDLTLRLICIWCHCCCDVICFNFCFYFTNWIGRRRFICRLKITCYHWSHVSHDSCYLLSMWNWNWSLGCLNCWCCSAQCCLRRSRIWNNWIRLDYLLGICLKSLWVGENLPGVRSKWR